VIEERPQGEAKAAQRLSLGQFSKAIDRWIEGVNDLPADKRQALLTKAEALVARLRETGLE
jgi:hypothetical protein